MLVFDEPIRPIVPVFAKHVVQDVSVFVSSVPWQKLAFQAFAFTVICATFSHYHTGKRRRRRSSLAFVFAEIFLFPPGREESG